MSQIESLSQIEEKLNNLSLTAKNNIDNVAEINVEDFNLIMNLKPTKTKTLKSRASGKGSII